MLIPQPFAENTMRLAPYQKLNGRPGLLPRSWLGIPVAVIVGNRSLCFALA
ncbi:hypothetical protein SAMN06265222_12032 [Neorhodopirellula lusitana]|uniref:Uncharacterized protein n=1 Tax=Neorhodopirellula lusitana TaxID=445327 RepID=A0ABY1QQK9_9BACT|nr:hypothetical protein SAMN06265222_12032 [Neorhodopirellula lusitana]